MEYRIEEIKEKKILLQNEIDKRELILKKYKKIKNTFGVIGKVSAVVTTSTGAGGIITASTVALLPVSIALNSVVVVCGLSLILSTKLFDCVSTKIEKHRCIKLLAINKLEQIHKIIGEDEDINAEEFKTISNHYEEFHKLKSEIQNKYKSNIN